MFCFVGVEENHLGFVCRNWINLGIEAGIQEDVGGLEISVDDCRLAIFM